MAAATGRRTRRLEEAPKAKHQQRSLVVALLGRRPARASEKSLFGFHRGLRALPIGTAA
jgi:hypothetical protein